MASDAPTGQKIDLLLTLNDDNGNTQVISFSIFVLPQLDAYSVTPRLTFVGSNVLVRATFRGVGGFPDENGIASVVAHIQASQGGGTYIGTLVNNPATTGVFETVWIIPSANDWNTTLYVTDTEGHTGTYSSASTSGFSSRSCDGSANVLLFDDYTTSYGADAYRIAGAISNASLTCFVWQQFYRGNITPTVLAAQTNKLLFYYAPAYPTIYYDTTLRASLASFISGGGRVCLAGGLTAYTMGNYGDTAANTTFMSDCFGSVWVKQFYYSCTFDHILGVDYDPLGNDLVLDLDPFSFYRDLIRPVGAGQECLRYDPASSLGGASLDGTTGGAGMRTSGSTRNVFLPWDLGSGRLAPPDRNQIVSNVLRYLSCAAPRIELSLSLVQDADADGYVEPDEEIRLTYALCNYGMNATNVQVTLSTTSTWCSVTQGAWVPGNMPENARVTNNAAPFRVHVAAGAPLGMPLPLRLNIVANGGAYSNTIPVTLAVAAPVIALDGFLFNDSAGNTNGRPDPGERIQLVLRLTNSGYRADNVSVSVSCTNAYAGFVSSNASFGTLEHDTARANSSRPFCFDIAPGAPPGLIYPFDIHISYDHGYQTNHLSFQSRWAVYTAASTGAFSWIDTTNGTVMSLHDEDYAIVVLGFNFPFYGQTSTVVKVVANGFLSFASVTNATYENDPIPSTAEPNALIAPLWDDLYPAGGGLVRFQRLGSAPNRYLAVEWNGVRHYDAPASLTFEVILYESGQIRFQYGPMSGEGAGGSGATIGLETHDGTDGIQYSCLQAGAVYDGLVLDFFPRTTFDDADSDGLPDNYEAFYSLGAGHAADGDADSDGASNINEMRCGTDPMDAASALQFESAALPSTNSLALTWQSVIGKTYNIHTCTNLPLHNWSLLNGIPIPASGTGFNCYTTPVNAAGHPGFFRIVLP